MLFHLQIHVIIKLYSLGYTLVYSIKQKPMSVYVYVYIYLCVPKASVRPNLYAQKLYGKVHGHLRKVFVDSTGSWGPPGAGGAPPRGATGSLYILY